MKTLLWMMVVISVATVGRSARAEPIKMAWFVLPPHIYSDEHTGQPRGAGVTYFEAVAAKMGYTVDWGVPLPIARFADMVHNARDGVVGLLFGMKFPKFEQFLHFTDIPFYEVQAILAVRKDTPLTAIHSIDDIAGYRIGFAGGAGSYTPSLEVHRDRLHFEEIFGVNWVVQNLRKLVIGRIDAVFDRNAHTLRFTAAQVKLDTQIKILPLPDPPVPVYVAFSKAAPQGERLTKEYNAAVKCLDVNYGDLIGREFERLEHK